MFAHRGLGRGVTSPDASGLGRGETPPHRRYPVLVAMNAYNRYMQEMEVDDDYASADEDEEMGDEEQS